MRKMRLLYDTARPSRLRPLLVFLSVLALLVTTAQVPALLGSAQASTPTATNTASASDQAGISLPSFGKDDNSKGKKGANPKVTSTPGPAPRHKPLPPKPDVPTCDLCDLYVADVGIDCTAQNSTAASNA